MSNISFKATINFEGLDGKLFEDLQPDLVSHRKPPPPPPPPSDTVSISSLGFQSIKFKVKPTIPKEKRGWVQRIFSRNEDKITPISRTEANVASIQGFYNTTNMITISPANKSYEPDQIFRGLDSVIQVLDASSGLNIEYLTLNMNYQIKNNPNLQRTQVSLIPSKMGDQVTTETKASDLFKVETCFVFLYDKRPGVDLTYGARRIGSLLYNHCPNLKSVALLSDHDFRVRSGVVLMRFEPDLSHFLPALRVAMKSPNVLIMIYGETEQLNVSLDEARLLGNNRTRVVESLKVKPNAQGRDCNLLDSVVRDAIVKFKGDKLVLLSGAYCAHNWDADPGNICNIPACRIKLNSEMSRMVAKSNYKTVFNMQNRLIKYFTNAASGAVWMGEDAVKTRKPTCENSHQFFGVISYIHGLVMGCKFFELTVSMMGFVVVLCEVFACISGYLNGIASSDVVENLFALVGSENHLKTLVSGFLNLLENDVSAFAKSWIMVWISWPVSLCLYLCSLYSAWYRCTSVKVLVALVGLSLGQGIFFNHWSTTFLVGNPGHVEYFVMFGMGCLAQLMLASFFAGIAGVSASSGSIRMGLRPFFQSFQSGLFMWTQSKTLAFLLGDGDSWCQVILMDGTEVNYQRDYILTDSYCTIGKRLLQEGKLFRNGDQYNTCHFQAFASFIHDRIQGSLDRIKSINVAGHVMNVENVGLAYNYVTYFTGVESKPSVNGTLINAGWKFVRPAVYAADRTLDYSMNTVFKTLSSRCGEFYSVYIVSLVLTILLAVFFVYLGHVVANHFKKECEPPRKTPNYKELKKKVRKQLNCGFPVRRTLGDHLAPLAMHFLYPLSICLLGMFVLLVSTHMEFLKRNFIDLNVCFWMFGFTALLCVIVENKMVKLLIMKLMTWFLTFVFGCSFWLAAGRIVIREYHVWAASFSPLGALSSESTA